MSDPVAVTPGPNGAWLVTNQRPFGPFLPSGSICRVLSIWRVSLTNTHITLHPQRIGAPGPDAPFGRVTSPTGSTTETPKNNNLYVKPIDNYPITL